jgi:hypothetical protein
MCICMDGWKGRNSLTTQLIYLESGTSRGICLNGNITAGEPFQANWLHAHLLAPSRNAISLCKFFYETTSPYNAVSNNVQFAQFEVSVKFRDGQHAPFGW